LTNGHMKMEGLLRILPRSFINCIEAATQRLPNPVGRKFLIQMAAKLRKPMKIR